MRKQTSALPMAFPDVTDKPLTQRFWAKVLIGERNDCWLWLGSIDKDGRGRLGYDGKILKAHRVSWVLHNGPIYNGLHVLHSCDNPSCVNPIHLFLGTHADNMADKAAKGRAAIKLSVNDILMIRNTYKDGGISQEALGKYFRISIAMVNHIINRKCWRHVP